MSAGSAFGEGTRLTPQSAAAAGVNASYVRRMSTGLPQDTNSNGADFVLVSTDGAASIPTAILGAPGPENLSSPLLRNAQVPGQPIDATVGQALPPNRVRDQTPVINGQFGTLSVRRRLTNNTGATVTRLRFRVVIITSSPAPDANTADLRALTSVDTTVVINDPTQCDGRPSCTVPLLGTTLEEPPSQSLGGGLNSSLSAGAVSLASPFAAGTSLNLQFLLGVQQRGTFKFFLNVEALP